MSQFKVDFSDPGHAPKVYKEECMWCYHTPEYPGGLYVSLQSFLGFCEKHMHVYAAKTKHDGFLHCCRKRIYVVQTDQSATSQEVTKVAIGVEGGFNPEQKKVEFEDSYTIVQYSNGQLKAEVPIDEKMVVAELVAVCNKLIVAEDAMHRQNLTATANIWGGVEKFETKHKDLSQIAAAPQISKSDWVCEYAGCELKENLWLNLTDGTIYCGRKVYMGPGHITGGNEHAKQHYGLTGYPLVVKLGTITAHGADVFSYDEDGDVTVPNIAKHLAHFGIDMKSMEKTEKTTMEVEVEMNEKYEWSAIQEEGTKLQPVYGPGYTGLVNLGSSCYINSAIQTLSVIPEFSSKYGPDALNILLSQTEDPTEDFVCQTTKLFSGLLSGHYSQPPPTEAENGSPLNGIRPVQFRSLVGRGHVEFSTPRQQDAEEYIRYLFEKIEGTVTQPNQNPVDSLRFKIEERLLDQSSKKVQYSEREEVILSVPIPVEFARNKSEVEAFEVLKKEREEQKLPIRNEEIVRPKIPFQTCLHALAQEELLPDYRSPVTNQVDGAAKRNRIVNFPDYLFIQAKKFTMGPDFAPKKLDIDLEMDDIIDLEFLKATGLQPDEEELPKDSDQQADAPDPLAQQLTELGFTLHQAKYGLSQTNQNLEQAAEWLFMNADNVPPPASGGVSEPAEVSQLSDLGFTRHQAKYALLQCNNNLEQAANWLFTNGIDNIPDESELMDTGATAADMKQYRNGSSKYRLIGFISHMGSNTHCGHYVAHLFKDGKWVIFNDEKVALSEKVPKGLGYIYLFQRM